MNVLSTVRRGALAALVAALLAVVALTALRPATAEAATRECGLVTHVIAAYDVTVTNTGCGTGVGVARRWLQRVLDGPCDRFTCRVGVPSNGRRVVFGCRAKPPARISYTVRCTASARRVVTFAISAD